MVNFYITGDTFNLKEDIKKLKPNRKDFNSWWKYNYDFKCWELNVPNNFNSSKYEKKLQLFCNEYDLKLEICKLTKSLTKSISDFESLEAYFQYFHKHNQKVRSF